VYSAPCSETDIVMCTVNNGVRLLLVCVQRTVQSETLIGVCTEYSAERDRYWCMCSAQCRLRLLLVCVQCTV